DLRTRAGDGVHDLPRRGVDHLVVIGLEPDADLLSPHRSLSSFVSCPRVPFARPGSGRPLVVPTRLISRPPRSGVSRFRGTQVPLGGPASCWWAPGLSAVR